jgi:hypothetical protein
MRLSESLNIDLDGYAPAIENTGGGGTVLSNNSLEPAYNPVIRCPLPPVSVTPDSLRQYYLNGQIPQYRLLTPQPVQNNSTITNTTTEVVTNTTGTTSGTTYSTQKTLVTGKMNPSDQFQGTVTLSPTFAIQRVTVSAPARVRVYGTQEAQVNDAGRSVSTYPVSTSATPLVLDVVIDDKTEWSMSPFGLGANGDTPQLPVAYVTVDSLAPSTVSSISVGFIYAP